jgi:hypothetical protein
MELSDDDINQLCEINNTSGGIGKNEDSQKASTNSAKIP